MQKDLDRLSLQQALIDVEIANRRVIALSQKLSFADSELKRLRDLVSSSPKKEPSVVDAGLSINSDTAEALVYFQREISKFEALAQAGNNDALLDAIRGVDQIDWFVDEVDGAKLPDVPVVIGADVDRRISVTGWALSKPSNQGFLEVSVHLIEKDGAEVIFPASPIERFDLVRHFGEEAAQFAGFFTEVELLKLKAGEYRVVLVGLNRYGRTVEADIFSIFIN